MCNGPTVTNYYTLTYIIAKNTIALAYMCCWPESAVLHIILLPRTAFGMKFVGCPVIIHNIKYQRNALIFNVCFVFNQDINTAIYGPVVKKLAAYMIQLEVRGSHCHIRTLRRWQ